jgi:SNF2 family DNA or RNA helicase
MNGIEYNYYVHDIDPRLTLSWDDLNDNSKFQYKAHYELSKHNNNYNLFYNDCITIDISVNKDKLNELLNNKIVQETISSKINFGTDSSKQLLKEHKNKEIENQEILTNLKIPLYDYQKNTINLMKSIENSKFKISISNNINFSGVTIFASKIFSKPIIGPNSIDINVSTNGGIIADEMGLGKTITSIAFAELNKDPEISYDNPFVDIDNNWYDKFNPFTNNNWYFKSKANLIIVPSHLGPQWEGEIIKTIKGNPTVITLYTAPNHNKVTFKDIINADYVIVSQQFLGNFKHYPACHYEKVTPSKYDHEHRMESIRTHMTTLKKESLDKMLNEKNPILELFKFNRIFLDEAHEIIEGNFNGNGSQFIAFMKIVTSMKCKNKWYISGTPFASDKGINNILTYLDVKIDVPKYLISEKYKPRRSYYAPAVKPVNMFEYDENDKVQVQSYDVVKQILGNIMVRKTRDQVDKEVNFMGYKELVHWVTQTKMEKEFYDSVKNNKSKEYLVQLCCHFLVANGNEIAGHDMDLDSVQEKLIEYHDKVVKECTEKLAKLDPNNQTYHMHKKNYTEKITQSKFLLQVLNRLKDDKELELDENCAICFGDMEEASITKCGHIFCTSCISASYKLSHACPMCKTALGPEDVYKVNKDGEEVKEEVKPVEKPLAEKYGAKMAKMIELCRQLMLDDKNRIIVFSSYDTMLQLISRSLKEIGVSNSFVKGNVWQRNAAIRTFKKGANLAGDPSRVIMLSLQNAASGTNLTEGNHIIFVEPINKPKEVISSIEKQAIARACRIGQTQEVTIHRILTKDTVEEEIYKTMY